MKALKIIFVYLSTLPMMAFADRYGIYDDDMYSSSGGGFFSDLFGSFIVFVLFLFSLYYYFTIIKEWYKRIKLKQNIKFLDDIDNIFGKSILLNFLVALFFSAGCFMIFKIFGVTGKEIRSINIQFYLLSVFVLLFFNHTYIALGVSIKENMRQSHNNDKPTLTKLQEQPRPTKTKLQPQPKPFTLPFHIKDKPEYQPTIGIKSNQVASSFIVLIRRITIGYLKSCMEDDSDFYEGHFNNPVFIDDRLTVGNANTIVQFIHDYVWYIMSENTPISSNHRLMYGIKYTPFILNITNNFHQEVSVVGIQRYVESLIDYYIEIILADNEPSAPMMEQLSNSQSQEMQSVNIAPQQARIETNNKKQKSDDKGVGILEIIGFCAMGLIMYNGVLKEKFNSSPKESVTTKAPDLIEQPLPNTGDTDNPNFYGDNPLIIKTQYGKNYWVRISNSINDATMASYFVRGGDTLNIEVPKGSYTIKYASGDSWYGTAHLFGKKTQYAKADKVFEFNNNGYTIELIYQTNGNLNSKQLNANQF